jgi:hypothetical protein
LAGLPLVVPRNPGDVPAVLTTVSRKGPAHEEDRGGTDAFPDDLPS